MKILVPRIVWIGATDYKIKINPYLRVDEARLGCIDRRLGTISIDKNLRDSNKSASFYHEVLHAINDDSTLHLDDDTIERLANALNDFLFRNSILELDWSGLDKLEEK